jgi:hypothetical protein
VISKLREIDEEAVEAVGPRFDLTKVLAEALGILRTLMNRSAMRFPESDPPTYAFSDSDAEPFDDGSFDLIAAGFEECKRVRYDATLYSCEVQFGPFMADLYPLGFDCLHGPVGNCLNDHDLDWSQLDPTPVMLVMMRMGMIDAIVGTPREFLMKTLESYQAAGVTLDAYDVDGDDLAFQVRFPHETFGDGIGTIRICRYLHRVHRDGEMEEDNDHEP